MTKTNMTNMQALQAAIDTYGAHPERWPQSEQALVEFMKQDKAAAQLFAEEQALEQLLDLSAPDNEAQNDHGDLQGRILADFAKLQANDRSNIVPFANRKSRKTAGSIMETGWMTAAALAACFAFGIYLGGVGIGDWTLDPTTSIASLSSGEDDPGEIGDYVMSSGLEEELL